MVQQTTIETLHAGQRPFPPLQKSLTRSPRKPELKLARGLASPAKAQPQPPPKRLTRRSSSVDRIVTRMSNQVEMRYRTLRDAFRAVDRDASGGLDRDELLAALFNWHVPVKGRQMDMIMANFDRNGDASISYSEFCDGLKPYTVRSQPVFGLADQYVTNKHRVLPEENRVLLNDNVKPALVAGAYSKLRPDYHLYELPRGAPPASPKVLNAHTRDLADRIHTKFKNLKDAFRSFDENKDGKLSQQELLTAVRCFNLPIPKEHVLQLAKRCDVDSNGLIDYNEFANVLKRKDALGH